MRACSTLRFAPSRRGPLPTSSAALRQAEIGTPVADITRKLGISEGTFYVWKKRFGSLGTPEIRELRQLRDENAKLKAVVAGLKWTDVHLDQRAATIRGAIGQIPKRTWYKATKTERVARIALSDHAIEALPAQRVQQAKDKLLAGALYDDQGFVFAPPAGGMPSPQAIAHATRRIARKAGTTGLGVHAMRHSTGTWLIRAGIDVRTVAALLRHPNPSTTLNVYAHEVEGAQADAVRHLLGANGNRMATAGGSDPKNSS